MNDEKRVFIPVEPSLLEKEIDQLQELLKCLIADTSVLIYTRPDGARGLLGSATAVVWEGSSASPFRFPLHDPSANWLEDCTESANWLEDCTEYVN